MKISRQRKRAITLRKYAPVLMCCVVLIGLGAMLVKHENINLPIFGKNEVNSNAALHQSNTDNELNVVDNKAVVESIQPILLDKEISEIKDIKTIVKVSGDKNQVTIEAKQAKLSEVVQHIKSKFEVSVNDYTHTIDDIDASKTFILQGTLTDVLDSIMRRYGYENLVVNNETSTTPATVYLLDADSSSDELELLSTNEEVPVPETTVTRLLSKLSKSATQSSVSSTSGTANNVSSTNKVVNAKSSDDNSQANTLSSPNISIENGEIPPELQEQLANSTQQAISDVQNLVQALRQNEAQMKANKFMNQQ